MFKNGIRYSDKLKQQIIELYRSGQSVLELSREYGVATVTIYKWIKQFSSVKVSESEEITARKLVRLIFRLLTKNQIYSGDKVGER